MSAIDVSERSFEPLVLDCSTVMPVVVDFWAPWCQPCLALAPLLEAAAAARKGEVVLVKVDVDLCPELWQRYEVRNVPAVKAFRDGEVVAEFAGMQPRDAVERFFDELVAAVARARLDSAPPRRHDQPVPIYDYACASCDERFDDLSRFDAPSPACPTCGSAETERLLSTFLVPNSPAGQRRFSTDVAQRAGGEWAAAAPAAAARTPASRAPVTTRLEPSEREHDELSPEAIDAAGERAFALLEGGETDEGIALVRALSERAVAELGDESEVAGLALAKLAEVQRQAGAPEAEQLAVADRRHQGVLRVRRSVARAHDERVRAARARRAERAGRRGRGDGRDAGARRLCRRAASGDSVEAGEIYATLAMAAAARQSPAALGAAERAHTLTAALPAGDPARKRARTAWTALGSPRRLPVTDELAIIAFGAPPSLVVEFAHVADDGAADQHNHGMRAEAARAFRAAIATAPFAWRASAGGFEVASRAGDGAVLRFLASDRRARGRRARARRGPASTRCAPRSPTRSAASSRPTQPGRNDPCPCGSGAKYKKCCGR